MISWEERSFFDCGFQIADCGVWNNQPMIGKTNSIDSPEKALRGVMVRQGSQGYRLIFLFPCFLLFSCLVACQQVQKPELKGEGPLAVVVPRGSTAPEYHAPIERWRTLHMEAIHQGDFTQRECVLCHNPKTGCNRCHQYIGAKLVVVPEAELYWPEGKSEKQ